MTPPSGKSQPALKTVTGTAAKVQRNPVIAICCAPQSASMTGSAIVWGSYHLFLVPVDDPDPDGLLCRRRLRAGGTQPCCRTFSTKFCKTSATTLAATLKNTINTAVQQRTAVGLVGLLVALYSGINWMGNLREAIRAQSRDVWERRPQDEEKIWVSTSAILSR